MNNVSTVKKIEKVKTVGKVGLSTLLIVFTVSTGFAVGTKDVGTASLEFLRIGTGARASGCGESFTAIADDATAIFWNPGGLSQVKSNQLSIMHLEWLNGFKYDAGSLVRKGKTGVVGFGFVYLHNNYQEKTYAAPEGRYIRDGSFLFSDRVVLGSYGWKYRENIFIGFTGKLIQEKIDRDEDFAFVGDAGMVFATMADRLRLAVALQNTGIGIGSSPPILLRLGMAIIPFKRKVIFSLDVDLPKAGRPTLNAGAEYNFKNILKLRAGYKYKNGNKNLGRTTGLTVGMGIQLRGYLLDYAFVPYGELGDTHRVSFGMQWGKEDGGKTVMNYSENTVKDSEETVKNSEGTVMDSGKTVKDEKTETASEKTEGQVVETVQENKVLSYEKLSLGELKTLLSEEKSEREQLVLELEGVNKELAILRTRGGK